MSATYLAALEFLYTALYCSFRIVLTEPMTYRRETVSLSQFRSATQASHCSIEKTDIIDVPV